MSRAHSALRCPQSLAGALSVLVVDDEEDTRGLLVEALALCPLLAVTGCGSRQEAESWLDSRGAAASAIVLDLYLPQPCEGLAVAEQYARLLPVVVVTGRARAAEAATAMEHGAVKVLEKPVMVDALLTTVGLAALRHRLRALAAGTPFLVDSVECLFARWPTTVTSWAVAMGPGLNYLERRWQEKGWSPREVLRMFHLCCAMIAPFCTAESQGRPECGSVAALRRYYEAHEPRLSGFFGPKPHVVAS